MASNKQRYIRVGTVLLWMEDNIAKDVTEAGHAHMLAGLSWFVACAEADNLRELSSRELASVVQCGGVGPYETRSQLSKWFQTYWDARDEEQTYEQAWSELTGELTEFFVSAPAADTDEEDDDGQE